MDNTFKSPNVLSLCPGMLGLERGVERAYRVLGWSPPKTIAYVEIEAFIIENLVRQMEQGLLAPAPIWSNIKTFSWEILRGKVDFFFGGYPCQPFSVSGAQKGEEDPRHLFPYIANGIAIIRPRACFFENVSNHFNIGYESVRRKLQDLGYRVEEGLYSAEEVGAPHRRERMFILAIMDNTGSDRFKQSNGISAGRNSLELASEMGDTSKPNEQWNGLCKEYAQRQIRRSGSELANTNGKRVCESSEKQQSKQLGQDGLEGRIKSRWPAFRGQEQHSWEHPRIESRLGFTVNGYKFREDLLRMAGNGVVEQQAEYAFLDLLKKHEII